MRRVLIIGPCGAGKSTLARKLGPRLDLPVHHMDQLNWKAGWVDSSKDEIRARLAPIIAGDRWLIDGNYGGTLAPRLARADTILYLDFPIRLCVARLLRRIWTWRGRSRPDMPAGCPERLDLGFLVYLIRWNSGPRQRTEAALGGYEEKVVRLPSPAALDAWIAALDPHMASGGV
jgi:adenylate kinase family enzyme